MQTTATSAHRAIKEDVEDLAHQVKSRFFSDATQRRSMLVSQLPLTGSLLTVAVMLAFVRPAALRDTGLQLSLMLALVITVLCVLLPWNLLPAKTYLSVPLLDFVVVGLAREATASSFSSLGLLLVFPVIWLAAREGKMGVVLSFSASLLTAAVPLFAGASATPSDIARPFLLPLIMTVIALAVHILVSSLGSQDAKLKRQDEELRKAYEESLARQRLLDTMLDVVGVGVHAVDAAGNDILVNRQHRRNRALSHPSGKEQDLNLLASDGSTPLPPEHGPVARAARGQSFSDYIVRLGSPTNNRVLSSTARAMTDKDGNFAGSVLAFSDVTELVNALAIKDDFVANISHEFRSPLMSIIGYLDLVLDTPEDRAGQHREFLRVAQSNAEKLLNLVSDLLSASSDSMGVHPQKMDLLDLIRISVVSASPRAGSRGVEIINEAAQPLWLTADPFRVGQVLDNLLSNAIKYSGPGGTVTIRAWDTGREITLSVTDTGIGISQEDLPKIFTRYFRSNAVRESAIPGVGLGLGIVKRIVENHGGSITASSRIDVGSTFTVILPKGTDHDAAETDALTTI
ncbi:MULTISPECIES: cell wall metabolism sensor histidine kinase WalK [unclassified Arthrobacter]|uniref:sensor histidine kinase n=1 Tax=unclassified Arthrobacter TaxID=235627 RepID=UPI001C85E4BA|nr:PAS domain-containing sensor histidine kinase [Arthrobacter sp. MAHUQ-56]MBX7444934.1 PAS domain-containing sensor histidine kinase [Arthrobacter sp. MAHUQ-56]